MAKIYIAGKITGLDGDECEGNFLFAEGVLEKAGHTPLNPLKMVEQRKFVPGTVGWKSQERPYNEMLLDAVNLVLNDAEGVYMLNNWRDSRGARIEHAIAIEMGLPIYYQASRLPVGCDWPEVAAA